MTERTVTNPGHPMPPGEVPAIARPRDVDFPGVIGLRVDGADIDRRIFQVVETIPVPAAGLMTLFFPKWLPGYHAPRSPLELFAGLVIKAGETSSPGGAIRWRSTPSTLSCPKGRGPSRPDSSSCRPPPTARATWP
jgi:hypothetical protein